MPATGQRKNSGVSSPPSICHPSTSTQHIHYHVVAIAIMESCAACVGVSGGRIRSARDLSRTRALSKIHLSLVDLPTRSNKQLIDAKVIEYLSVIGRLNKSHHLYGSKILCSNFSTATCGEATTAITQLSLAVRDSRYVVHTCT
jgi:hypothetical protein